MAHKQRVSASFGHPPLYRRTAALAEKETIANSARKAVLGLRATSIRAVGSGQNRTQPHRSRATSAKRHFLTDAQGIPLSLTLTGAKRNDVTQLLPLIEAIPPIRGKCGRPLSKPSIVQNDRGYDHDKYCKPLHVVGITTEIDRWGQPRGSGLGKTRWVVERTIAWLRNFKRLQVRFKRLAIIHEAS